MATPHNTAEKGQFAKTVLMPGDPLRAKYIAEHFLTDAKCINEVRGMLAYTGTYQGKEVSVMGHGMGVPSWESIPMSYIIFMMWTRLFGLVPLVATVIR